MTTDEIARGGKDYPHITDVHGDEGENPGVLSVFALMGGDGLIIVGSPKSSPNLPGYIPDLGCFSMGIDGARQLIATLQKAVSDIMAASKIDPRIDYRHFHQGAEILPVDVLQGSPLGCYSCTVTAGPQGFQHTDPCSQAAKQPRRGAADDPSYYGTDGFAGRPLYSDTSGAALKRIAEQFRISDVGENLPPGAIEEFNEVPGVIEHGIECLRMALDQARENVKTLTVQRDAARLLARINDRND